MDNLREETKREFRQMIMPIIRESVCEFFNISISELHKRSRQPHIVYRKRVFQIIAFYFFNKTDSEIANYLNIDRTTVLHNVRKFSDEIYLCNKLDINFNAKNDVFSVYNICCEKIIKIFCTKSHTLNNNALNKPYKYTC